MNHGWSLPFFSKTSCFFLGHYYCFSCLPSVLSQCRVYTDLPSCNSSFFVTPQILFFKAQFKVKHSLSNFLGHSYIKQEVRSVLPTLGCQSKLVIFRRITLCFGTICPYSPVNCELCAGRNAYPRG